MDAQKGLQPVIEPARAALLRKLDVSSSHKGHPTYKLIGLLAL